MIQSKKDYLFFLKEDLRHAEIKEYSVFHFLTNIQLRYLRLNRKIEYLTNAKSGILYTLILLLNKYRYLKIGERIGFSIPINVIDSGLGLPHYGTIIVTPNAKIGKNCRIHPCTVIGRYQGAPIIGNNVYIGPGSKIFGNISIGDNVSIGANSVVNASFPKNVTIGGVPAKIISKKSTLDHDMFPKNFLND